MLYFLCHPQRDQLTVTVIMNSFTPLEQNELITFISPVHLFIVSLSRNFSGSTETERKATNYSSTLHSRTSTLAYSLKFFISWCRLFKTGKLRDDITLFIYLLSLLLSFQACCGNGVGILRPEAIYVTMVLHVSTKPLGHHLGFLFLNVLLIGRYIFCCSIFCRGTDYVVFLWDGRNALSFWLLALAGACCGFSHLPGVIASHAMSSIKTDRQLFSWISSHRHLVYACAFLKRLKSDIDNTRLPSIFRFPSIDTIRCLSKGISHYVSHWFLGTSFWCSYFAIFCEHVS